jgi:hypothetical protein
VILPNPRRTPGAAYPAVTPATISRTICVVGWTARVRPNSSYTTELKRHQLASGYAWHGDTDTGDYEEDHLIPLELGGSPSSPANLWPEPYQPQHGAISKDAVENRLHDLVCSGGLALRAAQRAIATDWFLAGRRYAGEPATTPHRVASARTSAASPAHRGCMTTSAGHCIRGGQFCPKNSYGRVGYDATGTRYRCTGAAGQPHWE